MSYNVYSCLINGKVKSIINAVHINIISWVTKHFEGNIWLQRITGRILSRAKIKFGLFI